MALVEKYRPIDFKDVIGQSQVIEPLIEILKRKALDRTLASPTFKPPNMLFIGPSGTGKTTIAHCFARAYLGESWRTYFTEFNASDSRKIDDIRLKVKPLSQLKVEQIIFMDEFDGTGNDAQQAFRRIMELSKNTVFILSGNQVSKIIEQIQSRCTPFRFKPLSQESILEKLISICKAEGVSLKFDEKERQGFMQIVEMSHGDLRKAINQMEKLITSNKEINAKNVIELSKADIISDCIKTALNGDFDKAKNLLEDAYIMTGNNTDLIFDDLTTCISKLPDTELKANLYYKLGDLEHRLQTTHRPLMQFISFISYIWIAPHLKRS